MSARGEFCKKRKQGLLLSLIEVICPFSMRGIHLFRTSLFREREADDFGVVANEGALSGVGRV